MAALGGLSTQTLEGVNEADRDAQSTQQHVQHLAQQARLNAEQVEAVGAETSRFRTR